MEEQNKNSKIIVIIIAFILLISIAGFYAYKKGYLFKSKETNNNPTISNSKQAEFKEIENKYLNALYGYTDLNGVYNQPIMKAILVNSSFYPTESFTKEQLDEAWKKSVFSKIPLKHEDLWFNGYGSDVKPTYSYDEAAGKYTANPVGHGVCRVTPVYKKVIDYREDNGQYTIKYKYIWYYGCEGDQPYTWYGSYNDAKEQKNAIYEIDATQNSIISTETITQMAETNWDNLKTKLDTYTYTFIIENNHYVLDFFQREDASNKETKSETYKYLCLNRDIKKDEIVYKNLFKTCDKTEKLTDDALSEESIKNHGLKLADTYNDVIYYFKNDAKANDVINLEDIYWQLKPLTKTDLKSQTGKDYSLSIGDDKALYINTDKLFAEETVKAFYIRSYCCDGSKKVLLITENNNVYITSEYIDILIDNPNNKVNDISFKKLDLSNIKEFHANYYSPNSNDIYHGTHVYAIDNNGESHLVD